MEIHSLTPEPHHMWFQILGAPPSLPPHVATQFLMWRKQKILGSNNWSLESFKNKTVLLVLPIAWVHLLFRLRPPPFPPTPSRGPSFQKPNCSLPSTVVNLWLIVGKRGSILPRWWWATDLSFKHLNEPLDGSKDRPIVLCCHLEAASSYAAPIW